MNIPESFIHDVWAKGLAGQHFTLDTGDECRILNPGIRGNRDGPDFENSEIIIGNQQLAGNAEIHLKSSDWFRHGHHTDPAYDKTILHIVLKNDAIICNNDGVLIPAIVLPRDEIEKLYCRCAQKQPDAFSALRCSEYLDSIEHKQLLRQIQAFTEKRFKKKAAKIRAVLEQNNNNWQETIWKILMTSYGLTLNTTPMEWLGNVVPWKQLVRLENIVSVEAILLGQAGFLEKTFSSENAYALTLQKEFIHWKNKFSLKLIDVNAWKYSPSRPPAFPEIRLAQVAALLHNVPDVFSRIVSANSRNDLYAIFRQPVSEFWKSHFRLETISPKPSTGLIGKSTIDVIIINAIVPILYSLSETSGNKTHRNTGFNLLKNITPEQNKIIDIFVRNAGIVVSNAFETQGLIELYSTLCSSNSCMLCPIMTELIRTTSHE